VGTKALALCGRGKTYHFVLPRTIYYLTIVKKRFAADAVCRSAPLAHSVPEVQDQVTELAQLWESQTSLLLPQLPLPIAVFITVKLINELLIAL